jgi:hypothetical protein
MGIDVSNSTAVTIDELILDAYKKATVLPIDYGIGSDVQWAAKAAHGRRTLNRVLNSLSTHRFFEYFINLEVIDLLAGESVYTMDQEVLNIVDDGSYIPASNATETIETTGETPVKPMSGYRWNQLSGKNAQGTPVHYFIERNAAQLLLHLWPVPSEAGKIRFRVHRVPGSSSVGSNNPDFNRHWELWAVYALAYEFSTDSAMPFEDRKLLRADRDAAFEQLKAYDTNNTPPDLVYAHMTPWSGRFC